jgi:hypothetical protein
VRLVCNVDVLKFSTEGYSLVCCKDELNFLCRGQSASKRAAGGGSGACKPHAMHFERDQRRAHSTISHMNVRKSALKQPSGHPGVKLIGHSGEQAYYVRSTPGMPGHTVLKNAAKTKAATKVHATLNASNTLKVKSTTTHRQLLARYSTPLTSKLSKHEYRG